MNPHGCAILQSMQSILVVAPLSFPKISRQFFDYFPKLVDTLPNFVDTFPKKVDIHPKLVDSVD